MILSDLLVTNDIEILDELGSGQFGKVHKCRYKGEICAIKINDEYSFTPYESLIQSYASHPGVVPIIGITNNFSILMPLMDGSVTNEKLSMDEIRTMTRRLVEASVHMDELGIYHNDMHKDNILFKRSNKSISFYITDFGIAKVSNMYKPDYRKIFYNTDDPLIYHGYPNDYVYRITMILLFKLGFDIDSYYKDYSSLLEEETPPEEITQEMISNMNKHIISKLYNEYNYLDDSLKDYIIKTIYLDFNVRMSVQEVLNHPYIGSTHIFKKNIIKIPIYKPSWELQIKLLILNISDKNVVTLIKHYYNDSMNDIDFGTIVKSCENVIHCVKYSYTMDKYEEDGIDVINIMNDIIWNVPLPFIISL